MADSVQIEASFTPPSASKATREALEPKGWTRDEEPQTPDERIVEGDVLTIALYCPRRPDRTAQLARINQLAGFPVCGGCITLPELSTLHVAGLTLKEAREKLQRAYQDQLPEASLFVNFRRCRPRQVFVVGAHRSTIELNGTKRLSTVLAEAQLPPHVNLFKSYVMREERRLPVNLYRLLHQGDENQNIAMQGGDRIYLAKGSDAVVMVTGEVPFPQAIPLIYGALPLREAIVLAGGIPFTGDKRYIQVVRGNRARPKIYCLNWRDITHTPNSSLLLIPGDVVVVSSTPITEWNRFINQLQPSTTGVQATYNLYKIVAAL